MVSGRWCQVGDVSRMSECSPQVQLGRITGHYGVRGWVKVHSDTQPRDNIVRFSEWVLLPRGRAVAGQHEVTRRVKVVEGREQGKTIVARLEGIEDRDAAQSVIGCGIAVGREELPSLGQDEFYWTDLVGAEVSTVEGIRVGRVIRLFETGANDVLVVRDERDGSKAGAEVLVPWIRPDVVAQVDLQLRQITVDWDPDF